MVMYSGFLIVISALLYFKDCLYAVQAGFQALSLRVPDLIGGQDSAVVQLHAARTTDLQVIRVQVRKGFDSEDIPRLPVHAVNRHAASHAWARVHPIAIGAENLAVCKAEQLRGMSPHAGLGSLAPGRASVLGH